MNKRRCVASTWCTFVNIPADTLVAAELNKDCFVESFLGYCVSYWVDNINSFGQIEKYNLGLDAMH